jgi:hypothetical protein
VIDSRLLFLSSFARRGMYEHGQKCACGSRRGLHACDGLYVDQGCGRTIRGTPQASGRRSGVHSGNGTAPRLCQTGDLLGEGENRPHIRAGTTATINPEEYGKKREEKQKDGYIENPPLGGCGRSLLLGEFPARRGTPPCNSPPAISIMNVPSCDVPCGRGRPTHPCPGP